MSPHNDGMTEHDQQPRQHEHQGEFAQRRSERDLDDEERRLEREMADFEKEEERAKLAIEAELVKEHWGHDPERPLAWERKAPEKR